MSQYSIITSTSPLTIANGVDTFRYYVDGDMHLQQIVSGSWEDIEQYSSLDATGVWRIGVRDSHWVIDFTITELGFSGDENIDWVSLEEHSL